MLELRNISSGYVDKAIIKDVSLCFNKSQLHTIVGPNGCGKTTLVKTAMGMLPLLGGEIIIDGMSLSALNSKKIAQKAACLQQGRAVADMTVEQLVLHGRFPHLGYPRRYSTADKKTAYNAMEKMGISHLAEKSLSTLSGGMRQSVYIAMALCQDTDYILLDEPGTYLDISNRFQLMDILRELADDGKGIIAVLHDLPAAMEYSDTVTVMQDGKALISAPPDEVYRSSVINNVFEITLSRTENGKDFSYFCTKK